MRKFTLVMLIMGLVLIGYPTVSQAQMGNPYLISNVFDGPGMGLIEDTASAGLYDKPTWYQWLYRVDVVETASSGLSHITLEIQDCYSLDLLEVIASTAGYNNQGNLYGKTVTDDGTPGGNEIDRTYEVEFGLDGSTGIIGIKWNADPQPGDDDEELKELGEYDLFWFSAPTDQKFDGQGLVKAGQNVLYTDVYTPDCPECDMPEIPEPSSMLLLGSGLCAAVFRKKFKRA